MSTEIGVQLPANARIATIAFDQPARSLRIGLADGGVERIVSADGVRALHGARIRRESVRLVPRASTAPPLQAIGMATSTAITGVPHGFGGIFARKEEERKEESLHYSLAMRVDGVGELWYLMADSFNFRKALGPEAAYVTEFNVRTLVKRLATFTPDAVQDAFFTAVVGSLPLPPPVESLLEFFRTVSRQA